MELIGDLRRSCEVREVRTAGDRLIVACGREETDSVVSFFESRGYTTEQINVAEKLYDGRIDEWHDRVTVPIND
jgi:3-mercaptopyruvate sulfurtransferase SseA